MIAGVSCRGVEASGGVLLFLLAFSNTMENALLLHLQVVGLVICLSVAVIRCEYTRMECAYVVHSTYFVCVIDI